MKRAPTLILCFLLLAAFFPILLNPVHATGANWLTGWNYRKSHLILHATGANSNYQIQVVVKNSSAADSGNTVNIDASGGNSEKLRSDFGDIRFTATDGSSLLYAWNETFFSGANLTIWVAISDSLSSSDVTIYLYYGKTDATAAWATGWNVFPNLFDNFDDASINTTSWGTSGSPSESGGYLSITHTNDQVVSKSVFHYKAARFSLKINTFATLIDVGFTNETAGGITGERWLGYVTPTLKVISGQGASYTLNSIGSPGTGVFKTYDIQWAAGDAKFLNDGNLTEHTTNVYSGSSPFQMFDYPNSGTASISFDWVFVRNYVNPEPAHSTWGTEEPFSNPSYDQTKVGTNTTESVGTWLFYSFWYILAGNLEGYIFSHNASSTFQNDTWTPFTDTNNSWANVTKTISNAAGSIESWLVYANSSAGFWTTLTMQNVTVTATIVFYWDGSGLIQRNGTSLANGTSTTYNAASTLVLSGLPETNHTYLNFTTTFWTSTDNPLSFQVQNATTIWAYFGLGYDEGWTDGNASGYASGYSDGYVVGYAAGYSAGYFDGNATGWIDGNATGWAAGNATGYGVGYAAGYAQGYADGSAGAGFTYAIARFDFLPSNPENITLILFNGSQSYFTDSISDYSWNFGDGNTTSSGAQDWILHVYGTDGSYDVSLTVTAAVTNMSAVIFHQVNVTSAAATGGLSRTMPEDLASWVIGCFIFILILIAAIVVFVRRRR